MQLKDGALYIPKWTPLGRKIAEALADKNSPPRSRFPDFDRVALEGFLAEFTGIGWRDRWYGRTPQQRYQDKLTQHRQAIGRRVWHTKARLVATGQWYNPTPEQRAELRRKARP